MAGTTLTCSATSAGGKGWKGSCRQLVLTLSDGQTHTAYFRFR